MKQKSEYIRILFSAAVLLVLGAFAVVSATYAWLGVSRVPFVSDVAVSVILDNALLIAPDENGAPGEWSNYLDASAFLTDMAPLKPVTYTPEAFCKVRYDETGRTNGVEPLSEENFNVKIPADASSASRAEAEGLGYMVAMPFWMKCEGAYAKVYLSEATETADGQMGAGTYVVGAPKWDSTTYSHSNGGYGSEATIRMGFECTLTDMNGNPRGASNFIMYEPNADLHLHGKSEYHVTNSVNGGELIDSGHLIIQNASSWTEQDPALEGTVIYQTGEFVQNPTLFELNTDSMMHVVLYIWMEGQDEDCIAAGVADAVSLIANIQFGVSGETIDTGIHRS